MDPAGLLISIATIACTLDDFAESYTSASNTLALIKSQIKILETCTTRIQEWIHFTDMSSQMQVMYSLRDAVATVEYSLQQLHGDLAEITHTGPKTAKLLGRTGSDQWMKTKFAYNESRLRKHLTDVRECASLMSFTLNVCQLPVGKTAEQEVRELGMGAKTLYRVHTSARRQRRSQLQESGFQEPEEHSEDYNTFMKQVLDAEADLPSDEETPTLSRQASSQSDTISASLVPAPLNVSASQTVDNSTGLPPQQQLADRDDLHLPDSEVGVALSTTPEPLPSIALHSADPAFHEEKTPDYFRAEDEDLTPSAEFRNEVKQPPPSVANTPPIPPRSLDRASVYNPDSIAGPSRPSIKRKPLSRASISGSTGAALKAVSSGEGFPYAPADYSSTASPADSAYTLTEKLTPLTQSLSSLTTSDYLNVELDQPPVQPYFDRPPTYTQGPVVPTSSPEVVPARRRDTARSAQPDDASPVLIRLARENRIDDLLAYLRGGSNVNEADARTGGTAIMEAARFHRWEICRFLLQSGARLHLKNSEGDTALHLAAREGDAQICQMLIDSGALSQDCNGDGLTPLELAAASGHTEAVLVLANSMSVNKTNDPTMVKAFLESVKHGDMSTAQALLAKDVKPKKIKESWKPTAYAAQSGSIPMLDLMINQKCSLKERSAAGWTCLHYAARYGQQPMVERLLSLKLPWKAQTKKGDETALHVAAAAGHTTTCLALIAHKDANVTMKDADNQEPIHHAVRQGNIKLTTVLMDKGAKLSSINKYGWNSAHLAAAYGHVALIAECMTRGISIEERTITPSFKPQKRTNAAARRGYWAEIRWPHSGARALHLSLEFGHDDVANMLISGGAKLDEGDSRGWRPLHYAAFNCRPDMVDLLLQKGATADAKTVDGHTALTLGFREYGLTADQNQRLRIVERLEIGMAGRRKSRIMSLTGFMASSAGQSKTAVQRNLAWHTAQLAESLYQSNSAGENDNDDDDDDDYSVDSTEASVSNGIRYSNGQDDMDGAQASSSHVAKT